MNERAIRGRRVALAILPLLVSGGVLWFQWNIWPRHDWLGGDAQSYVPVIERFQSPGMLSRDLVATHSDLTYTAYDEITLWLCKVRRSSIQEALDVEQLVFRAAAFLGLFLLARSARLGRWPALCIAAVASSAGYAAGVDFFSFGAGPDPSTYAWGAVLLAAGLFARGSPLGAGMAGGVAALYDLRVAAPFWCVVLAAALFDRTLRRLIGASLPLLAVFLLMLANLAQLQPVTSEAEGVWSRLAPSVIRVDQFRSPDLWVSHWTLVQSLAALLVVSCCAWGTARLWRQIDPFARWFFLGLPFAGVMSVLLSWALLDVAHWSAIPKMQPMKALEWVLVFALLTGTGAAWNHFRAGKLRDALALSFILLVLLAARLIPVHRLRSPQDIRELSAWARDTTWGASMFLFPDAGRSDYPGRFRAETLRPVWSDWRTGTQVNASAAFADEWYSRWAATMQNGAPQSWQACLRLPVDYYVLHKEHALQGPHAVYTDKNWVVYDAEELRRHLIRK